MPGLGLQQITAHHQSTGITHHLHPQLFKTHLDMQLLNCMISKCRSTAKQAHIKNPSTDEATAIPSSCYGCTHQTPPWPPSHPLLRLPGRTWQLTHPHAEIDPPAHTAWLAEHRSALHGKKPTATWKQPSELANTPPPTGWARQTMTATAGTARHLTAHLGGPTRGLQG